MRERFLNHKIDAWPALLIISTFVLLAVLFLWGTNIYLLIFASILLVPARLSILAYGHNHIHSATFRSPALNRILELMMFLQTGVTPFSSTLNHIYGHHIEYPDPEHDNLSWIRADGRAMGAHEFAFRKMLSHYPSCVKFGQSRRKILRQFYTYLALSLLIISTLFIWKPVATLILFIIPMALMLYILKLSASNHHRGLDYDGKYTGTRTRTGRFYNRFTWNAGYHMAHHVKMGLHWSKLPAFHASIAHRIPPENINEKWAVEPLSSDEIYTAEKG